MPYMCRWFLVSKTFPVITFDASSRQSNEDIRKDANVSILLKEKVRLKKSSNSLKVTRLNSSRARAQGLSFQTQRHSCPPSFSYDNACLLSKQVPAGTHQQLEMVLLGIRELFSAVKNGTCLPQFPSHLLIRQAIALTLTKLGHLQPKWSPFSD